MAKIPYFDPATAPESTLRALEGRRQINIFKLIARADNVAAEVLDLGYRLSRGSSLDPREREVVILRVAELTDAAYQVHEHRKVALRVGFTQEKIDAIAQYPNETSLAHFSDFEQVLLDFTDAVVSVADAPDRLFEAVHERLGDSKTVELVLLIGFYMMIGRVMNTFDLELQEEPVEVFRF